MWLKDICIQQITKIIHVQVDAGRLAFPVLAPLALIYAKYIIGHRNSNLPFELVITVLFLAHTGFHASAASMQYCCASIIFIFELAAVQTRWVQ